MVIANPAVDFSTAQKLCSQGYVVGNNLVFHELSLLPDVDCMNGMSSNQQVWRVVPTPIGLRTDKKMSIIIVSKI
jgi:hypothetical protein